MSIFFDEKLSLDLSKGLLVSSTFKTKSLENQGGKEERIISWNDPLLSFDLSKLSFDLNTLDYLIDFFKTVHASAYGFRFRDCTDYQATAAAKFNKYGSITQGRLYPEADGTRTEFQLFKVYQVGDCIHYRYITRPSEITIFENGIEVTDWSEHKGKITFITPPTGELTADIIFDVPVSLAEPKINFKINKLESQTDSNYSLETLTLEEIREEASYYLIDVFGELPTFPLIKFKEGQIAQVNEVEIIDLSSGFDLRTPLYSKEKTELTLPAASFSKEELEHLITFWRCCKGRGLSFPVFDKAHLNDYLMMRFDDDNLSIEIDSNQIYKNQSIILRETFDNLPVSIQYANNPNADVQEIIYGGPGTNYSSSQTATTVNTTPTLGNPGSSNSSGGHSDFISESGTIIEISEIHGRLILFTFNNFIYPSVYRLFIETQPGNIDFEKKYELFSLDSLYTNLRNNSQFIDISDSHKGIVLFTETIEEIKTIFALSIDEFGNVTEDSQIVDHPDATITYQYHSSKDETVYLQQNITPTDHILNPFPDVPALDWTASGMTLKSQINLGGDDYEVTGFGLDPLGHSWATVDGKVVFYGSGERTNYKNTTPIQGTSYFDIDKSITHLAWIATVNGKFNAYLKNGENQPYPLPVEEQENINSIIYSDDSETIFEYKNDPNDNEITVTKQGYTTYVRLAGFVHNGDKLVVVVIKENNQYDPTEFKTFEFGIASIGEAATLVSPTTNLEQLEQNPDNIEFFLNGYLEEYQGRFYTGSPGVHYLNSSGELGKLSYDFSEMPNAIATALYASETRGLVLAYDTALKYLVITDN